MKTHRLTGWILAALCSFPTLALAAKNAELVPPAERFERQYFSDRFSTASLDKAWMARSGTWEIENGHARGAEVPAAEHAGVLTLKQPNRDSAIRFSFQFDGADTLCLSLDHAHGHLFRVVIRKQSLVILKDRDKKVPGSKLEQLAKVDAQFEPGHWYTVLVQIDGATVSVRTDNGVSATVHDERLDADKMGYRFVVRGDAMLIDDVRLWDAKQ